MKQYLTGLKVKMALALVSSLLIGTVSAETNEYRLGHLLDGIVDVFGFGLLDIASLVPDLLFFVVFLCLLWYVWRGWKRR